MQKVDKVARGIYVYDRVYLMEDAVGFSLLRKVRTFGKGHEMTTGHDFDTCAHMTLIISFNFVIFKGETIVMSMFMHNYPNSSRFQSLEEKEPTWPKLS